jgi:hypothetical protein
VTIDELREVWRALHDAHVDYVLIGSMAMAAQGLPRATHTARPQDRADAERLREAFGLEDE